MNTLLLLLSLILTGSVMKQIMWSDSWFDRKGSDTNKELSRAGRTLDHRWREAPDGV